MKTVTKIIFAVLCLSTFFMSKSVFAAEIRLDVSRSEIMTGDEFLVSVFIHSTESINTVEGHVVFPSESIAVKEIRDGNSVINFWLDKPQIDPSGSIVFSGITPGGFTGNNFVFSIVFEAKTDRIVPISLQNIKVLLNDGAGTELSVLIRDTAILVLPHSNTNILVGLNEEISDTELPEDFRVTINMDPNIFANQYFLVFSTQDKESGINHYEVKEGFWDWFREAESPYLLKNQQRNNRILVKAIDNDGNERISIVEPLYPKKWYESGLILGIILAVLVIGFFAKKIWPKFTK